MNTTRKIEKRTFEIETANGSEKYNGLTFGIYWNGWECPLFDLKTTLKVLKDFHKDTSEDNKNDYDFSYYEYDSLYDVIIEKSFYSGKIECIATSKPIIINKKKYYSVGSFNWTWFEATN
jgi:hypothetical protein